MKKRTFADKLFWFIAFLVFLSVLWLIFFQFVQSAKYDNLTDDIAFNKCVTYLLETDQLQTMKAQKNILEFTIRSKSDFSESVTYTNSIKWVSVKHAKGIFTWTYCSKNA